MEDIESTIRKKRNQVDGFIIDMDNLMKMNHCIHFQCTPSFGMKEMEEESVHLLVQLEDMHA